jgi:hypothetical protein
MSCSSESSDKSNLSQDENVINASKLETSIISKVLKNDDEFNEIENIRDIKLDLSEKEGFQYLYFVAEEDGETKTFAQSIESSFVKDFTSFNNSNASKVLFEGSTKHSCSGCSVCRFKKDKDGKIEGCLKYGECTCSHTVSTIEED